MSPEPVDFTPSVRWFAPDHDEGTPLSALELLVTIADHTFALAYITDPSQGYGYGWGESDTDNVGNEFDFVEDCVADLRKALPKWAALIPDIPAETLVQWIGK